MHAGMSEEGALGFGTLGFQVTRMWQISGVTPTASGRQLCANTGGLASVQHCGELVFICWIKHLCAFCINVHDLNYGTALLPHQEKQARELAAASGFRGFEDISDDFQSMMNNVFVLKP